MTTATPGQDHRELLRGAGLRVTSPRLAVLDVLDEHPHAEAARVLEIVHERRLGLSVQGVYDVLSSLSDAGVVRRIQPAHSPARYELETHDNHHHVVCRGCGAIHDVPCAVGAPPCIDPGPAQALGFSVDEAEVIYWGRCPTCRAADPAP